MRTPTIARAILVAVLAWPAPDATAGARQPDPQNLQDLKTLSIEQLMEIDVTLPTREAEPVRTTAAAIEVITADDIRRAGVTTIADAIALANGVHVARFGNGAWAITSRGFNATSANKLLVMMDGRTEFSPLFAGTFWNMVDYVLEDVDRIEVIRGPGATLWGANAVNGVVNIVTRHSRDTRGAYALLGSGNEDPALAELRYGGAMRGATYRVYGKYAQRDEQVFNTGVPSGDARRRGQVGIRLDGGRADGDSWLFKADAFHSSDDFPERPQGEFTELAAQGGWSHPFAPTSRLDVRGYYRREYRRVPQQLTHYVDSFDVDTQHAFTWQQRHRVVWGSGFRLSADQTAGGVIAFSPAARRYTLFSAFAQDEIAIRPDRLYLTAGLKMERNSLSGAEWQPNVRVRLQLAPRQMIWSSIGRAVRRPTRLDVDLRAFAPTGEVLIVGGESFDAEALVAGEVGYRVQLERRVAFDATVFIHRYRDLRSQELPAAGPPLVFGNTLNGRSRGLELTATVEPLPVWRVHAGYTYLNVSIDRAAGSRDVGGGAIESNDPRHQAMVRTYVDLPRGVQLGAWLRRVGQLPNPAIPAFTELVARVGWSVTSYLEVSLAGQDLLHSHHPEFGPSALTAPRIVEFERSLRVTAAIRY